MFERRLGKKKTFEIRGAKIHRKNHYIYCLKRFKESCLEKILVCREGFSQELSQFHVLFLFFIKPYAKQTFEIHKFHKSKVEI